MTLIDLRVFNTACFEKYLSKGDELQELEIEAGGTFVGYGIPNDNHNCDAMGCPTFGHILFIL